MTSSSSNAEIMRQTYFILLTFELTNERRIDSSSVTPNLIDVGSFNRRRSGLQGLLGARRSRGEEETASDTNDIHVGPAEGAGTGVPGDALSGHLHQGGDRDEDRSDGG